MAIGIDARIAHYNQSGISRYAVGLLDALGRRTANAPIALLQHAKQRGRLAQSRRFTVKRMLTPPHSRFEQFGLALELPPLKLDALHALDFYAPVPDSIPLVCTVHDLYFLRNPQSVGRASYRHYEKLLRYAERSPCLICDSAATRSDLLEYASIKPEQAVVVYPGFSKLPAAPPGSQAVSTIDSRFAGREFILSVGTIEPRKNYLTALKAYAQLAVKLRSRMPHYVIVGKPGYRAETVLELLEQEPYRGRVHCLTSVSDQELAVLFRRALLLFYPSLYEGFGFPLLDAMAFSIPILTSNVSSMPEITAGSALTADPDGVDELADKLEEILLNQELRDSLTASAAERLNAFSWDTAAAQVDQIYTSVVDKR